MTGSSIQSPTHYRHLGVLLTPTLDFSPHIKAITNKFRTRIILFSYMSRNIPQSALTILYKCFIRPTIEYAIPVWTFELNAAEKDTLDKLQARAARSYLAARGRPQDWLTPKVTLNELSNWDSLQWRRQILSLCYFHHVVFQFPSLLEELQFNKSTSSRHPNLIRLPRALSHFAKSFIFKISIEWNKLPEKLRSVTKPSTFNEQIREHYSASKFCINGIPNFSL